MVEQMDIQSNRYSTTKADNRLQWRLVLVVTAVTFGSNFQIYTVSVVNNPKDIVSAWINHSYTDHYDVALTSGQLDLIWSFVAASGHIAGAIGSMFISASAERLGRRGTLILLSILNIIGGVTCALSKTAGSFELFIAGRFILGFSLGLGFGIASMFITEIPPIQYRGSCATMQHIFVGLGDFVSLTITLPQLLGTTELWPLAFGFPALPGAIQLIVILFHPETPRYSFISKGNEKLAKRGIEIYHGRNQVPSVLSELQHEKDSIKTTTKHQISLVDLFRHYQYRKPLIVSLAVAMSILATGIGPVMGYSTNMFLGAGLSTSTAKYSTCAVGFTNFFGGVVAIYFVERRGRRQLLLGGLSGSLFFLTAMAVLVALAEYITDVSKIVSYASIATLLCYQFSTAIANSVMWFIASELFAQNARSIATGLVNVLFWGTAAILVFIYLPLRQATGVALSLVPFIAILALLILYLYRNLPETKNKDIQSIQELFTIHKHQINQKTINLKL